MNNRQKILNTNVYDMLYSMNSALLRHRNQNVDICIIDLLSAKIPFDKNCCGDCCDCLQKFLNNKEVRCNDGY